MPYPYMPSRAYHAKFYGNEDMVDRYHDEVIQPQKLVPEMAAELECAIEDMTGITPPEGVVAEMVREYLDRLLPRHEDIVDAGLRLDCWPSELAWIEGEYDRMEGEAMERKYDL